MLFHCDFPFSHPLKSNKVHWGKNKHSHFCLSPPLGALSRTSTQLCARRYWCPSSVWWQSWSCSSMPTRLLSSGRPTTTFIVDGPTAQVPNKPASMYRSTQTHTLTVQHLSMDLELCTHKGIEQYTKRSELNIVYMCKHYHSPYPFVMHAYKHHRNS